MTRATPTLDGLADEMALIAARLFRRSRGWVHRGEVGRAMLRELERCTVDHGPTRTRVMLTRDAGMHSSGWLRNPEFERCFHLSLSPFPDDVHVTIPHVEATRSRIEAAWVRTVYREHTPVYVARAAVHGRREAAAGRALAPVLQPRVAAELGWRSASQVLAEDGILIESPAGVDP